jgi:hypothetical protein
MKKTNKNNNQEKRNSVKSKLLEDKINDLDNKIKELKHVRKWTFIGLIAILSICVSFFIFSIMYLNENLKDDVDFYKTNVCISKVDFDKLFKNNEQLNEYENDINVDDSYYEYEILIE